MTTFEEMTTAVDKICNDISGLMSERNNLLDNALTYQVDMVYLDAVDSAARTIISIINQYKAQNGDS